MKKLILSIFTIFICFACNADCIELKRSVILKTASQTCEPNTLYLLQSLKECGFDSIEIEIFTSQPIFVQIMQSLILNNDSDISIEDFILGFNEFKKNEKFSEYYEGTKQSLEFYSEVITSNNINSHLSILEGFNGTKQAESFKSFLKKQNFIDAGISFKKVLENSICQNTKQTCLRKIFLVLSLEMFQKLKYLENIIKIVSL